VARLQQYTIKLYEEIERVSGQNCSIHLPGGLMLADTEVRMDFLRMAQSRGRYLGMDLELISAREAQDLFPLLDPQYFVGALYDPVEGHVDPTGVTRAYAKCAQLAGAEIRQHTKVDGLSQRVHPMPTAPPIRAKNKLMLAWHSWRKASGLSGLISIA
jgi:dimethylglycine dehydrogenase